MLYYLIGLFSFLSGTCLALATRLYYKDKIFTLKQDWLDALRKEREEAYQGGYTAGMLDEKVVQAAKKQYRKDVIRRSLPDDITQLIPAVK